MDLAQKHLVLGMTGGIAAYKVCELARRLQDDGASIQVVMTQAAQEFVTATTMQALTGRPVVTDLWDRRIGNAMPHIDLTRHADAIVVAPASANFIAKLAHGLSDDLLSTLALARRTAAPGPACPLLVAPAMNVEMWQNPATQRNVATIKQDGVRVLGPASGDQACGEVGSGRMLEPDQLRAEIVAFFQPKVLRGRRVLMTAGPTFEPIDPVRGITNLSSGKMGFALARAAREAGAEVSLVAGPTTLATPYGVDRVDVHTAQQMYDAVMANVERAEVFIAVAAVADWRVANPSASKLKKNKHERPPALEFAANPDILATVAARAKPPFCVGFAAESENVIEYARAKLRSKKVPLIVANQAQHAFGRDDNEVHLIDPDEIMTLQRGDKLAQARLIVAEIARRLRP